MLNLKNGRQVIYLKVIWETIPQSERIKGEKKGKEVCQLLAHGKYLSGGIAVSKHLVKEEVGTRDERDVGVHRRRILRGKKRRRLGVMAFTEENEL